MTTQELTEWDANYDEAVCMVGSEFKSPGYHTTLTGGRVHSTTNSLRYALALVKTGEPERLARAGKIIRKLISLQDQDPASRTYGIWSWFYEEPLEKMAPPDWNWADFCGEILVELLKEHGGELPDDLVIKIRESLLHAARCIKKRDVQPTYTNIAVLGGSVTAAAGEILGEMELLEYGRERLEKFVAYTEFHGNFTEYNSPNYSFVVINACNDLIKLVEDERAKAAGEKILRFCWENIARHFHPATKQWAGPHSRAYQDKFPESTLSRIFAECPEDLKSRLKSLPEKEYEMAECFVRFENKEDLRGKTWFTENACLSTINKETMWVQRRPLLGYWLDATDDVAVFRLRFLHDGKDFASAYVLNDQQKNKVLSTVTFITDGGDFHVSLDKPRDGVFTATDFRVRYEIAAKDVAGERTGDGRFILKSKTMQAVISPLPGVLGDETVKWQLTEEDGIIALDGVCYSGKQEKFKFADIGKVMIAAGMELLPVDAEITESHPQYEDGPDGNKLISWEGLKVSPSLIPQPISYY